jgi:adenylate cyclase
MSLMLAGEPERAIQSMEAHMRLDPFYGPTGPGILGLALYMLRRHDEALPYMQQCVMRAPNMRTGRVWLAANYAQMGEPDKAKAVVDEILRILPSYRINQSRIAEAIKRPEDRDHYLAGLRKAGLPEIHDVTGAPRHAFR